MIKYFTIISDFYPYFFIFHDDLFIPTELLCNHRGMPFIVLYWTPRILGEPYLIKYIPSLRRIIYLKTTEDSLESSVALKIFQIIFLPVFFLFFHIPLHSEPELALDNQQHTGKENKKVNGD
jgi:hypothetical protein